MATMQLCETLLRMQVPTGAETAGPSLASLRAILAGGVEARLGLRLNESAECARFRVLRELSNRTRADRSID